MIYTHAVAALIAAALAATGAWQVQEWRYSAKEADRLKLEQQTREAQAKTADAASEKHEVAKVQIKTEFQTIYQEVERVVEKNVYRNLCLDDGGLRLLARALNQPAPAGQSAPDLPGPDRPE